jgi:hypothetical protein
VLGERELLTASQAGYRLPLSSRCLNQFRALTQPADRGDFDREAKVLAVKTSVAGYSEYSFNSAVLPKRLEIFRN